jgi:hypothetical protein
MRGLQMREGERRLLQEIEEVFLLRGLRMQGLPMLRGRKMRRRLQMLRKVGLQVQESRLLQKIGLLQEGPSGHSLRERFVQMRLRVRRRLLLHREIARFLRANEEAIKNG